MRRNPYSKLRLIPEAVARHTAAQRVEFIDRPRGHRAWPALMRLLDGIGRCDKA